MCGLGDVHGESAGRIAVAHAVAERPYNVLFLCTGNSARSILAEALLNQWGRGRFQGFSAGSHPTGAVRPEAIRQIEKAGPNAAFARRKSWDEFSKPDSPHLNFVFTVCDNAADEVCPIWPGQPMTAHWGIADPAAVQGSPAEVERAYSQAFQASDRRISLFLSLPFASIDTFALQKKLNEIGKS